MPNTYFEARQWAFSYLDEADVNLVLMIQNKWTYSQLILHLRDEIVDFANFKAAILRINAGEPVQYVLGEAHFFGRDFMVDERVLIPRLETEELIELILNDNPITSQKVLDIGTGSGAIAITLKSERPKWQITASDISLDALTVAQQNADKHQIDINFIASDIFTNINERYDIIVSNPPYIAATEMDIMDQNVIDYEPHLALFADNDGLAIYQAIARQLTDYLKPNGHAYFEIGLHQGPAVAELMKGGLPHAQVDVIKDLSNHDRMIRVFKKQEKE
ncbi:peptide chain release factor N(5)-glutamine methyltransferase [Periweissella fabalis]|uniref:Release factor glutamine methyltransferase n=1 Tax=Periweissella fabalis TaxID=1070421 RepID=A0A7X6N4M4_9LACO|nr:peptide chain release factor N(5)-glutamine methyltransferase [Periweissella fabalis]MCM0598892.1 peptide chain release factor N(5)-glutamine methyltransferase [Periweissella fabalis]NKZ24554.1 peptide chain release factor N(5)-glutamine methyltransferase [Periweissella fabalis]